MGTTLAPGERGACPECGRDLTTGAPRFAEVFGALQNLAAVLAAWDGDAPALRELLPERPRFLGDLDPPAPAPGDDSETRAALEALDRGAFAEARPRLAALAGRDSEPRIWRALAIACERRGDHAAAEEALARALAAAEQPVVRLQRGVLRARRGDATGAREDLERAGDGFEARWNRAALALATAVADAAGLPAQRVLEAARAEAGTPSPEWCDPTVGRLLWSLLVDRASARGEPADPEAHVLRAAEAQLEFDTFWDRAMVLEGYARLGLAADAERVAAPLALEWSRALAEEPFLAGPAAAGIAAVLRGAAHAIAERRPDQACDAIESLLRREDLQRYRVPCRCGGGAIGVVEVVERGEEADGEPLTRAEGAGREDRP